MIKNSKFLGLIATVLLGIVPFAISGTSVYAAENDQVTVDSEITQNKVYFSNPQDQS